MCRNLEEVLAELGSGKLAQLLELAMLITFEAEICGVDVLDLVELHRFNVARQAVSNQNWLFTSLRLIRAQNFLKMLSDLHKSRCTLDELLLNSMNTDHRL